MSQFMEDWFAMPQEILQELEVANLDTGINVEMMVGSSNNAASSEAQESEVLKNAETDSKKLSEFGKKLIKEWELHFKYKKSLDIIMEQYSDLTGHQKILKCFDDPKPNIADACLFLLDVIDKIAAMGEQAQALVSASISAKEADIIGFLGGFVVRRLKMRYCNSPQHMAVIANLEDGSNKGRIIALLEQKGGALCCPSMVAETFFQRLFVEASREFSKAPVSINTKVLEGTVFSSSFYRNFVDYLTDSGPYCIKTIEEVTCTLSAIYLKTLTFAFTRKFFEKMQSVKQSAGNASRSLRKDLKAKSHR